MRLMDFRFLIRYGLLTGKNDNEEWEEREGEAGWGFHRRFPEWLCHVNLLQTHARMGTRAGTAGEKIRSLGFGPRAWGEITSSSDQDAHRSGCAKQRPQFAAIPSIIR